MQKSFTTSELVELRNMKYWITKERYLFYAETVFGYSKREASDLYEIYYKFPFIEEKSTKPLEIAIWIYQNVNTGTSTRGIDTYDNELRVKVITENAEEYELNLISSEDAHKYHLLHLHNEKLFVCKYVDDHYISNSSSKSETIRLYEGDVYHNHDNFWSKDRHDAYVMINGSIRRLLYIKGVGYLANGQLNLDETKYSSYAVLGNKNFQYMGNVIVDKEFLKDKEQ